MNINIHCTNEDQPYKFDSSLGISFLNIAVNDAPYRTGNLRRAILLQQNGTKIKRIIYNDYDAYYLNFLEEGQGRNKMHKGFISEKTTNDILTETVQFLLTGTASFEYMPSIVFRTDRGRNYERAILAKNQISVNKRLTANDRAMLSRKYVRDNSLNVGKVNTTNTATNMNDKLHFGYAGALKSN